MNDTVRLATTLNLVMEEVNRDQKLQLKGRLSNNAAWIIEKVGTVVAVEKDGDVYIRAIWVNQSEEMAEWWKAFMKRLYDLFSPLTPRPEVYPHILDDWRDAYHVTDEDIESWQAASQASNAIWFDEAKNPGAYQQRWIEETGKKISYHDWLYELLNKPFENVRKTEVSLIQYASETEDHQALLKRRREIQEKRLEVLPHKIADLFLGFNDSENALEHSEKMDKRLLPPRGRSGRPRNPINDWAHREIYEKGRPIMEVYNEWSQKRRAQDPRVDFMDSFDSFKKAMRYRGGKNKENRD